jgi:hypothetical protein
MRSLFLWGEAYFIGVKYRQISLPNEISVALISSGRSAFNRDQPLSCLYPLAFLL